MYLIGYDVGGTKIEGVLFSVNPGENGGEGSFPYQDSQGRLHSFRAVTSQRLPTERQNGYEQIVQKMANIARDLCAQAKVAPQDLAGIGLGVPGSINPTTGMMVNGSIVALLDKPLAADLGKALDAPHLPIVAENDANCFALAEALCGAGIAHFKATGKPVAQQVAVGIILGTGVGGGFVINGHLVRGRHGGAAEIGHLPLEPSGIPCYCGHQGCAERYLSGTALEALFNQQRYSQISGNPNSREIFELFERNEPAAIAVVHQYRRDLARFLGSLATALDPDYFVLGGGVSLQPAIYPDLDKNLATHAFLSRFPVPVYQHRLGDSAGVVGAALLTQA